MILHTLSQKIQCVRNVLLIIGVGLSGILLADTSFALALPTLNFQTELSSESSRLKTTVAKNQEVLLRWTPENLPSGYACKALGAWRGARGATGSGVKVRPQKSVAYILECSTRTRTVREVVDVRVNTAYPSSEIRFETPRGTPATEITLAWEVKNATSCSANTFCLNAECISRDGRAKALWEGQKTLSSTASSTVYRETLRLSDASIFFFQTNQFPLKYQIDCRNAVGSSSHTVTVDWHAILPPYQASISGTIGD